MGCFGSRKKYLQNLKEISLGSLDNREIEEIIMNTYCIKLLNQIVKKSCFIFTNFFNL
jgi:hypothetical protein